MTIPPPPGALVPDHVADLRTAVVDQDDTHLTYGELRHGSTGIGEELRRQGVMRGDVVGVPAARTIDTVVSLVALWRMGAVPLVLDPARPDLIALVDDVGGWLVEHGQPIRPPGRGRIERELSTSSAPPHRDESAFAPPRPSGTPPPRAGKGAGKGAGEGAGPGVAREMGEGAGDAVWVPTSGSTGAGRIVRLTPANVAAAVVASQRRLGTGPDDRWLAVLPLFHVGGLSVVWRSFAAGGTVVIHDRFDVDRVAEVLGNGDVTAASLVPTMVTRLADAGLRSAPSLRFVLVGGAAADPSLLAAARAGGLPVLATYGATEACSQIATARPGDEPGVRGDVGVPLDDMAVSIVDGDGHPVVDGEVGHIVVDGPAVFPGYVGAPDRFGAHPTGDLGRWVGDRLVVVGRADDVIISGGVNIAPADVEASVTTHPDVSACVMVGVPDAEWGSVVVAVVQPRSGAVVDAASLDAHVSELLPPSHRPRRWVVTDEIPLLANGKIDRQQVQRLAGATGDVA